MMFRQKERQRLSLENIQQLNKAKLISDAMKNKIKGGCDGEDEKGKTEKPWP